MCSAKNRTVVAAAVVVAETMANIKHRYEFDAFALPISCFDTHFWPYFHFRVALVSSMARCSRIIRAAASLSTFAFTDNTLNRAAKANWCSTNAFAPAIGRKMWIVFVTIDASAIRCHILRKQRDRQPMLRQHFRPTSNTIRQAATAITCRCQNVHRNRVRRRIVWCKRASHTPNTIKITINCNLLLVKMSQQEIKNE